MSQRQNSSRPIDKSDQKTTKPLVITFKVAKWWPIYTKSMVLFCWTFGTKPDPEAIALMWRKAVKVSYLQPKKNKGVSAYFSAILCRLAAWGGGSNR